MSRDLDLLLSQPAELLWRPDRQSDPRQRYREIDAPLTRYLIGLARSAGGNIPVLQADWDWSKTWQENQNAGALPSPRLLVVSRMGMAWLFPLCLLLLYSTTLRMGSRWMGWAASLLFASNALILLHTRRAMAESALVFFIIFTLWALTRINRSAWLISFPIALAFNSKHSAVAMIPLGLIAILWQSFSSPRLLRLALRDILAYFFILALITLLLNPFLWSNPLQAGRAALQARQELVQRQLGELAKINPDLVLDSLPERFAGQLIHLFITKPAIADIGNYLAETRQSEEAYLANPMHNLMRGFAGGGLLLTLTILGAIFSLRTSRGWKTPTQRLLSLHLAGAILQLLILVLLVTLPFQRYCLPLVPFQCILAAFAVDQIVQVARRLRKLNL